MPEPIKQSTEQEDIEYEASNANVVMRVNEARAKIIQLKSGRRQASINDLAVAQEEMKVTLANQDHQVSRLVRTINGDAGQLGLRKIVQNHTDVIDGIIRLRKNVDRVFWAVVIAGAVMALRSLAAISGTGLAKWLSQ